MTVKRSQASVGRGQKAAYTVQVSTENNGTATTVSVALTAQPSGLRPVFTGGCAKGNGTATCPASSVSDEQPASLQAQIPVASATTSVTLTATASVVTSAAWTPPSAAVAVAVTAAPVPSAISSARPSASPPASSSASSPLTEIPGATLPVERIPALNNVSSSLIGASNASGLFPRISPTATPSPIPGTPAPEGKRTSRPIAITAPIGLGRPALTGQVAGLIALATAILLTVTRMSVRRRFRSRKERR